MQAVQTRRSKRRQEQEDAIEAPVPAADPLPVQEGGMPPNKNKEPRPPMVSKPYSVEASHIVEDILGFCPTGPPNKPLEDPLTNERWARSIKDGYANDPTLSLTSVIPVTVTHHYIVLHSCIVAIVWVPICSDATTNYRLF